MKRAFNFCLLPLSFVVAFFVVAGVPAKIDEQTIATDFADAVTLIEEHYAHPIDYEEVTKLAILGMLHTLDPHSNYYDKREFARFRVEQTSQYFGIGATIGARNGKVYILAPFPDTPAYRGGLRYGDQIIAINGESTENWPSAQVSARLRGPRGSGVEVQVVRAGEKPPRTVKLTRDAVPLPSIASAYLVRPGIGYINLQRGFNTTTDEEMAQALNRLQADGMKSVIIDLRNNPGGFLDQAVRMAEKFLYRGQLILTQKSRTNKRDASKAYESQNANPNLMPLIVLVNGGTASASEIVTAAIQEHDRGVVVGENTFGKALVQTIMPMPFGTGLTLTTAKYLTPSGRLIQRNYNLSFYEYYDRRRAPAREDGSPLQPPTGPAFRTDTGRKVYGDGGITPDQIVPATQLTEAQGRLQGVIFAFARELVAGLVPGLESYRIRGVEFKNLLGAQEYRLTDEVLKAFAKFALNHKDEFRTPGRDGSVSLIEENREFVRASIRFEVVTAAYGLETAAQVFNEIDLQLLKAIETMPKASELAEKYKDRPKSQDPKKSEIRNTPGETINEPTEHTDHTE
jgi:carboxyl-terminal processing protease